MRYKFFKDQKAEAGDEQDKGEFVVMVFSITMIQRIGAYAKRKGDHQRFKCSIIDDVNTKQRETAYK